MNFFLILFLLNFAKAEPKVLLNAEESQKVEYRVFLNLNKDFSSFSDFIKNQHSKIDKKIVEEYKSAKIKWSQAQLTEAQDHFNTVINLALSSHPSPNLQKLIFDAHLRSYQLQNKKDDKVLKNALGFLNPSINNLNIYGPIIKEKIINFKRDSSKLIKQLIDQENLNKSEPFNLFQQKVLSFNTVLINSKKLSIHDFFRHHFIKEATYHFTFINNSGFFKSFNSTPENLAENFLKTKKSSWLTNNKHSKNVYIFKNQKAHPIANTNIEELKPEKKYYVTEKQTQIYNPSPYKKVEIKVFKNKWFWVGVSALATAIYLQNHHQDKNDEQKPVIKDGL